MIMENYLYPIHPVRCYVTGPSNVGKSVFVTFLTLNNINEYDKKYIIHLLTQFSSKFISNIKYMFY